MFFLDYEKAYNFLHRQKILPILESLNIQNNLTNTTARIYETTKRKIIITEQKYSKDFFSKPGP
jgi:hypothetical protein